MRLQVKVVPGSSRETIEWLGDTLKIRVRAAPEKGLANTAVERLLAERLQLPRSAISIVSGHASRQKIFEIQGLDLDLLRQRLG